MPTYPSSSPNITVAVMLKQPRLIARDLTNLASNLLGFADRILMRGTPESIASGVAVYQRSESIFMNRSAEEVGVRSRFPRATWSEAVFTAVVRKYGLEHPISDEAKRRNQMDQVQRALRKIANSVTSFVDSVAVTALTTDANIQTMAASGVWTTPATDIIADIANARALINNFGEGYVADSLVVNGAQELAMLIDTDLRNALPRENTGAGALMTGRPVPILGLRQILVSPTLTAGTVLVTQAGVAGTIADEMPDGDENYVSYNAGPTGLGAPNAAPVFTKVYRNEDIDETIVRGARFPAIWLAEPKAVVKITGA